MDFQYKLIVGNQTFYKEFEIPAELERVKLGSTSNCEFRLNSDFFFEDIEISLEKKENWNILCSDNKGRPLGIDGDLAGEHVFVAADGLRKHAQEGNETDDSKENGEDGRDPADDLLVPRAQNLRSLFLLYHSAVPPIFLAVILVNRTSTKPMTDWNRPTADA